MTKDFTADITAFTHTSQTQHFSGSLSEHGPDAVDEVVFGFYGPQGGSNGEMAMVWCKLGRKNITPYLRIFCDAWAALHAMPALVQQLAAIDGTDITPNQFCQLLKGLGFQDQTKRKVIDTITVEQKITRGALEQ